MSESQLKLATVDNFRLVKKDAATGKIVEVVEGGDGKETTFTSYNDDGSVKEVWNNGTNHSG